jgi:O-antigen ligase
MVFWLALRASRAGDFSDISLRTTAIFISLLSTYGILSVVYGSNPILGEFTSNSVSATFVNRNNFATFAVIGLLANVTMYIRSSNLGTHDPARRLRNFLEGFFAGSWVFAIGTLICLAAVFFSESRAGFAAALLGLAVFSATGRRQNAGSRYAAAFIAVLVTLSVLAFSSGTFTRIFAAGGEDARFLIYPRVLEGISDRPYLGHGLGAFHDAFRPYVSPELSFREIDLAHSSYLENIFELGIPAAVAFYAVLLTIVGVIYNGVKSRRRNQRFPRFAFAVSVAVGFHAFFDFSLQIPAIAALFAFVLGLGWGQSFSEEIARKTVKSGLR